MAAMGRLEDRLYETERLVEIERAKLQSMRDAMFDSQVGRLRAPSHAFARLLTPSMFDSRQLGVASTQARRKSVGGGGGEEGGVDWRTLRGADFISADVPSNLGELIMRVGDTLSSSLLEAERDATLATEIIEAGDMTLARLAQAEDAARNAAAAAAAARGQQASPAAGERERAPGGRSESKSAAGGSPSKARKKSVKG